MPIYTRTGDNGTTSLFGRKRVLKCNELVEAYGSIDELNSWVGFLSSQFETKGEVEFLASIQSDLFTVGSYLAGWKGNLSLLDHHVIQMESRIDAMEKDLPKLRNFILPGGSQLGSTVHLARGVCRRVERQVIALHQKESVDPLVIKYLNRLSDFLFMLARFVNKRQGSIEIIWKGIDPNLKKK